MGCDPGRLFAPGDWLGAGPDDGQQPDSQRATHGAVAARGDSRPSSSFGPIVNNMPAAITRIAERERHSACHARAPWDNAANRS